MSYHLAYKMDLTNSHKYKKWGVFLLLLTYNATSLKYMSRLWWYSPDNHPYFLYIPRVGLMLHKAVDMHQKKAPSQ